MSNPSHPTERHQKEAARIRLQTTIEKVQAQLDRNASQRKTLELQILEMPNGISQLKQFVRLNQLQNRERGLTKRIEELNFQLSCLESYRIPSRDPDDTYDEWATVDKEQKALATEKALAKSRQNRNERDNDKER